jgi:hypothetical protein
VRDQRDQELQPNSGARQRGWAPHLSWTTLVLLGWLLYELTSQPGLAAAVACAKFGWADFRAALWLRRVDPDRRRGTACFWWYITFALWKVAVMSVLVIFLIGFISGVRAGPPNAAQARPQPASPVLQGVASAMGIGFGLSFLSGYVALWSALRHGVRVWLGSAPHRARIDRHWPPSQGQVNFATYVTFTTLVFSIFFFSVATLLVLVPLNFQPQGPWFAFLSATVVLSVIGGLIVAFTVVTKRIVAQSPQECWPWEPGEVARQAPESPL